MSRMPTLCNLRIKYQPNGTKYQPNGTSYTTSHQSSSQYPITLSCPPLIHFSTVNDVVYPMTVSPNITNITFATFCHTFVETAR